MEAYRYWWEVNYEIIEKDQSYWEPNKLIVDDSINLRQCSFKLKYCINNSVTMSESSRYPLLVFSTEKWFSRAVIIRSSTPPQLE